MRKMRNGVRWGDFFDPREWSVLGTARARRVLAVLSALLLTVAGASIVVWSVPAAAYEVNNTTTAPTGSVNGTTTSLTTPAGLTTTLTLTDPTVVNDVSSSVGTTGSAPSFFTPNLPAGTRTMRIVVGSDAGENVNCAANSTCAAGTMTVTFSQPVTNPVLHLYGIGSVVNTTTRADRGHGIFALASSSPSGATLGAPAAGATNLKVTGSVIDLVNYNASTQCDTVADTTPNAAAVSGCGSIPITGTVSSLTFNLSYASVTVNGGVGARAGDAVGVDFTVGQDFSDAPASYNAGGQAPAHVVGDLKLGPTIDAEQATTANPTTSSFATSGAAVNTAGDNAVGADEDAISTPWPTLTTAMIGTNYPLTVPISGASKAGQVCGWIDFDHSGTFNTTAPVERACANFAAGATSVVLNWTVPAQTSAGFTYARLRAAYGTVVGATGLEDSGEVEDYALTILPTVRVNKTITNGANGTFTMTVNGTTVATGLGNGGTSGVKTVGQSTLGPTISAPDVATGTDVLAAAVPLTIAETGSAGNSGTYASTYACVNGAGTTVVSGTGTSIAATIPVSGTGTAANGNLQNITCTFSNTGVPALTLTKTASPTSISAANQTVTYSFGVTNTGAVAVTALAVTDAFTAPSTGAAPTVSCPVTSLAPGAATTCTATYSTSQADIDNGVINNSATASAKDPANSVVTSNVATASVPVAVAAALTLTKSASPATVTVIGAAVAYSFAVTNTGNVTITGLAINDGFTAPAGPVPTITCPVTTLAPGATTTCTASYTSTAADFNAGSIRNSATATGRSPANATVTSNTATATVTTTQIPALSLTKSAAPTGVSTVGQNITYSFVVTNTGNVAITAVAVADAFTAPSTGTVPVVNCPLTTLTAAGTGASSSMTCTATYVVTQTDLNNGVVNNSATAGGRSPTNATVTSNSSTASVAVTQAGGLTVIKSASPTTVTAIGAAITYSFAVTNNGNVTINNLAIADVFTAPSTGVVPSISCPTTTLAPGAQTTCTGTYAATAADFNNGTIKNAATAAGTTPLGVSVVSAPSTATVTTQAAPGLSIVKTATPTAVTAAGQTVTYTFLVTNTGNVSITGLAVADTFTAPGSGAGPTPTCPLTTLTAAGTGVTSSTTCTATYVVTLTDLNNGVVNNSAVASGKSPTNATVSSNTSTAAVTASRAPALTLTKTANVSSVSSIGAPIVYTFTVTNSGNVTITGLGINDVLTAPATQVPTISCSATSLAPGASTTCTGTYAATAADFNNGTIKNSATATGRDPANTLITSNPSAVTVTATQSPSLSLVKSASPTSVSRVGDNVNYTFLVANTGNVSITGLVVADAFTTPSTGSAPTVTCPLTTLTAAGTGASSSTTCTATYPVTQADLNNGVINNTATASGKSPTNATVSSSPSTAAVTAAQAPSLTLTKSASPSTVTAIGATIAYSFLVTNTGNVTVSGLAITDTFTAPAGPVPTINCPASTLAPGASTTCTATYTATAADFNTGSVKNSATATARTPNNAAVTSNASAATVTATQTPALTVTKSASPTTVTAAGQTVTYSFLVANSGNVTVTGLSIADTFSAPGGGAGPAPNCPVTTLTAAGTGASSSTTCTASYVVTQADLNNGVVNNSAVVTGTSPTNTTVTSNTSTASVAATRTPALTLTKTATPSTVSAIGATVTYTFGVTNSGNVTISGLAVSDVFTAPAGPVPAITCLATTLAPAASTTCTGTYAATAADFNVGTIRNSATASGRDPGNATVTSNAATATVTAIQSPSLSLVKSAAPTSTSTVGSTVTYSFAVANTGNVAVTGLAIADAFTAPSTGNTVPTVSCPVTTLTAAGTGASSTTTCTATYSVTQTDLNNGVINNSATASAKSPTNTTVTSNLSTASVIAAQAAALTLSKAASPTAVSAIGAPITYTFTVTNSGNVTVTGLAISDTFTAPAGPPLAPITCAVTTLAPGAQTACTASYAATAADFNVGTIRNSATATGRDPGNAVVTSNPATASVATNQIASLGLLKSASPTGVSSVGAPVTYSFAVSNTGNVTVTGLTIADAFTAPSSGSAPTVTCPVTTLTAAGTGATSTTICTAMYATTQADLDNGVINNSATARGTSPTTATVVSNTSTASVATTRTAALTLTKAASPTAIVAIGASVTYTFTVTNSGNVTVHGLAINDTFTAPAGPPLAPITCTTTTLAPGAQTTCSAAYLATAADFNAGTIRNSATAGALDPANATVTSNPATATVTATAVASLSLTKSASPTTVSAVGGTVTYGFAVSNTGNVTVSGLAVADAFTAPSTGAAPTVTCGSTTLTAAGTGASSATTCSATYVVTQTDLNNGVINNTATAGGKSPTNATVTSNPSTASVTATRTPGLTLVKTATPASISSIGAAVSYSFAVTNSGNVTVSGLAINDAFTAPAGPVPTITCPVTTLAPGASTTCTASYLATAADFNAGSIKNAATATAKDPANNTITSNSAAASVTTQQSAALTLVKSAAPTTVSSVGATVTYTFAVSNTGNVTVTGLAVADAFTAPTSAAPPTVTCGSTTLAAAGTGAASATTCTASYVTTQADLDNGVINNRATASGTAPTGPVTSNASTAAVTATRAPALTLTKSANPTTVAVIGAPVSYTFTVRNSGNVTVTGLAISDSFTAPAGPPLTPIPCGVTTLAPGAQTTCTATYAATAADFNAGAIRNSATATGRGPDNAVITSNPSAATVTTTQAPSLTVVKSANPITVSTVGQAVTYTFAVANTGNVTLTGLAIADAFSTPSSGTLTGITCASTTLTAAGTGATSATTCTASYPVTQADLDNGVINNSATASAAPPIGPAVTSNPSTASITATTSPALTLVKSASVTSVTSAGASVTYSFRVTNSGNVTVHALAIADTFTAPAGPPLGPIACPVTTLAPAQATTCTAAYTVTQADIDAGTIANRAVANALDPQGGGVSSPPAANSISVVQTATLSLVKTATPLTVSAAGDVVTYRFAVTNTGNVTVTALTVADAFTAPGGPPLAPITCPVTTLAPAAQTACTATYSVSQSDIDNGAITNTATARGVDPNNVPVVSATSTAAVAVTAAPALTVIKSANPATASAAGQTITYSFLVTNTGNTTVHAIAITDTFDVPAGPPLAPIACPVTTLAPAAQTTCTATYSVTQADVDRGLIHNVATADGLDPRNAAVASPTADTLVTIASAPALTVVKAADPATVATIGQTIAYAFTVTNTGNVTLTGIGITDSFTAPAGPALSPITCAATSLSPGAQTTCRASYVSTAADFDAGLIQNSATATGTPPIGPAVTSVPSTAIVSATPAPALTVVKSVNPTTIATIGARVTFSFVVTNTGNVSLTGVAITDTLTAPAGPPLSPITCTATTLAAGAAATCRASYVSTAADFDAGTIQNSATATGTPPTGPAVTSAPSTAIVTVSPAPALSVVKSVAPTTVSAIGQTVSYSFAVTNTGNVTLTGLFISDTLAAPAGPALGPISCDATALAAGAVTTCRATYVSTAADFDAGTIQNSATATATPPTGPAVTSPPSTAVVATTSSPGLTVVKSASPSTVTQIGDTVTYSFAVTNTGNVSITGLTIDDTLTAPAGPALDPIVCPVTTLTAAGTGPTSATTCTATYVVSQADIDHGSIGNSATASGQDPRGVTVTSDPSVTQVGVSLNPRLQLVKRADPGSVTAAGQRISYTFRVTNIGNVSVHDVFIDDALAAPAGPPLSLLCPTVTLPPGGSATCIGAYRVTQADIDHGSIANSATASASPPTGPPVTSNVSTATVNATQTPALSVVKSANPPTVTATGQAVTYSFRVTNTGNVTVTDVAIADVYDAPAGPAPAVSCPVTSLAPNASTTCTSTYSPSQADVDSGTIHNTATATGHDPSGADVVSPPSAVTVAIPPRATLTLAKSASPTTVTAAGQTVNYRFLVTNTGNVTVTGLQVQDTFVAPAGPNPTVTCPVSALAPGAATTCTAAYSVTQDDIDAGAVLNSAIVGGVDPHNNAVTSTPSTAVVASSPASSLTVVKSVTPTTVTAANTPVTYRFAVTNSGAATIHGLTIDDTFTAPAGPVPAITCPVTTLAPGGTTTCTATYPVSQADVDAGGIHNSAVATGLDPANRPVRSDPSAADIAIPAEPAVTVVKTADVTTVTAVGNLIHYSFRVTNTGNQTLRGVAVSDVFSAPAGPGSAPTCPVATLAPGAQTICTSTYSVTQADIDNGAVLNTATAQGTPPVGTAITSPPSAVAVLVDQSATLTIVKAATPGTVHAVGDQVSYSFTVRNSGNLTLTDIAVTDTFTPPAGPELAPVCPVTTLAPGDQVVCTATYTVTAADVDHGSIANSATASGTRPDNSTVTSSPAQALVSIPAAPGLSIVKRADQSSVTAAGQVIGYSFVVTNTGNVTVDGLTVADVLAAPAGPPVTPSCPVTTLAAGASTTCIATYPVTAADLDHGRVDNRATASGLAPNGTAVTSTPSAVSVPATATPALSLVKTAGPSSVDTVGDTVSYSFAVTNSGNVTLTGISVADTFTAPAGPALSVLCPAAPLPAGQTVVCVATYRATAADFDAGTILNSATASGTPPTGAAVTSAPSSAVVTAQSHPALTLDKAADQTAITAIGTAIHYTFRVTNTGNVTVHRLAIADTFTAPAGPAPTVVCPVTTLAGGGTTICTTTYVATAADFDAGTIANNAIASGLDPNNATVMSPADAWTVSAQARPALALVKTASTTTVATAGDRITFSFALTNTGNLTLTDLQVDDTLVAPAGPALSVQCPVLALAAGAKTTCTAAYTVTGADVDNGVINNSAVAMGTPPGGATEIASNQSSVSVDVAQLPRIALVKHATLDDRDGDLVAGRGDFIDWTFAVTNTGNVTLQTVGIADAKAGSVRCPVTTLAPGAATICTAAPHQITQAEVDAGVVTNTATAKGTPVCAAPLVQPVVGNATPAAADCTTVVSLPSTTATLIVATSILRLAKSAQLIDTNGNGAADPGERVRWTITVTNAGTATLRGIAVSDPTAGRVSCPTTTLRPDATMACTVPDHVVTQADVAAGEIRNIATARATGPDGPVDADPAIATVATGGLPFTGGGGNGGGSGGNGGNGGGSGGLPFTGVAYLSQLVTGGALLLISGLVLIVAGIRRRVR
jgi:uncharacterized repeat protein (TIGR01451 family)